MRNFVSRAAKILGQFFLWFCAALILFIIIAQISLWFGLQWLNSDKGEAWTKKQIDIALKDTDYTVDYSGFRYRPLTSLNVKNLSLSNSEGLIISAENNKVGVNILPLALREFSLTFLSDKMVMHRLPPPEENDIEKSKGFYLQEFSLPNLYFNKFNISKIVIQNLKIAEAVSGRKIELSPILKGNIGINEDNKIDFNLNFKPDINKISDIPYLPKNIIIQGNFNSHTALLDFEKFLIQSNGYKIDGKGQTLLREDGQIDMAINITSDDLSELEPAIGGNLTSDVKITGTQNSLALDATGTATMPTLEDRGLKPVIFDIKSVYKQIEGLQPATVKVSSSYKDIPVEIVTNIEQQGSLILAKEIKGSAPDIKASGNISFNLNDLIATGNISANIENLSTYKDLIQLDIAGKLKADIELSKSDLGQKAILNLEGSDFKYNEIQLKKAKLLAAFPTIDNYWPTSANWELEKLTAKGVILDKFSGTIKDQSNDVYALSTKGTGSYQKPFSFDAKADLMGLKINQPEAKKIDASIQFNNQPFNISGRVNANDIDVLINTNTLSLTNLSDDVPEALEKTKLTGEATIKGLMANPIINSDISLSAFSLSRNTPAIKIDIDAGYKDNEATIKLKGAGEGIKTLSGDVQTPLILSLNPFVFDLPMSQILKGQANLDLEIENLANSLLPPQYDFTGLLRSNITIAGTIQNPNVQGDINLSNAKFIDETLGILLKNMKAQGKLTNNSFVLSNLTANDHEKGTIKASGIVNLDSFTPQNIQMALDIKDFHLLDSQLADGVFDANLELSGDAQQYKIEGSIRPDYIDITIPERLTTNIPELNIVEEENLSPTKSLLNIIALNIKFIADNKIFVRGWGLDAEFGGQLKIDGNLDGPNFDGVLKSSRGRYTEFGKRFELTRANLNFLGRIPANPVLDIVAETKVEDIVAQVNLTGTIQDPKITFSSNPYLPEDEVLARILFGRDLSSISPFQAVQLAQTIRRFSGNGGNGFDPLGKIRDATGFDDLRVDTDEEGETTVGAGKYISDKVYLEFEKGSGENSGAANLEVEVTPNITLESQVGQDAQAGAGLFWEWDY